MTLGCTTCGAVLHLGENARTAVCPFCGTPSVVERPAAPDRPNPRFIVPFVLGAEAARDAVRSWARAASLFAVSGLRAARLEDVRGVYVPAYLYSALQRSQWTARIGETYTTEETYTTTDAQGHTTTHTRTVYHTEWRPLAGTHASYVTDVLVTASRAIDNRVLEMLEPFDTGALKTYAPAFVAGWPAEEPSRTQVECVELARGEASAKVGEALRGFMPGDTFDQLVHETRVENEAIDLVLVPIWSLVLAYDKGKSIRVLVNGQSGRVIGRAPISAWKVLVAIAIVLALFAAIYLWTTRT